MKKPNIGSWIRITDTLSGGAGVRSGELIRVGFVGDFVHPDRPELVWLTTGDRDFGQPGHRFGWVLWEPAEDIPACWDVLAKSYFADRSKSLHENIHRVIVERETERSRAHVRAAEVLEAKKRIAALEKELLRVQAPPGTAFVMEPNGPKPQGWTCPPMPETPDFTILGVDPAESDLRARCGRQRRELRRVNQRQRLVVLERDKAIRALEDTLETLVQERRLRRIAESINDAG